MERNAENCTPFVADGPQAQDVHLAQRAIGRSKVSQRDASRLGMKGQPAANPVTARRNGPLTLNVSRDISRPVIITPKGQPRASDMSAIALPGMPP